MQQTPPHGRPRTEEHAEYASLAMRFAAVVIDTVIVYVLVSMVWGIVLATRHPFDPQDPNAMQTLMEEVQASVGSFYVVFIAAVFVYYPLLESVLGASFGKLLLGMRVVMLDGSRVTELAVVVRNLVRIPEALLLYIPAGVSCLSGPRCQRLGDHAAHTVVVRRRRRRTTAAYGGPGTAPPAPPVGAPGAPVPPPATPLAAWPPVAAAPAAPGMQTPSADEALARLKTSALAARGAHLTYLRFSERELAAGGDEQAEGYSDGYVSAWFTLTDAVTGLRASHTAFAAAAQLTGRTPGELVAAQPDLAHLLEELRPYLEAAADDDAVHAAFLTIARAEAPAS